jgi:hypothetical protein
VVNIQDLSYLDIGTLEGAFDAMGIVQQFSEQVDRQASHSLDSAEMRLSRSGRGLKVSLVAQAAL